MNSNAIAAAFAAAGAVLLVPQGAVQQALEAPAPLVRSAAVAPASALPKGFLYDLKTGECRNVKGEKGLNKALTPEVLADFRIAECMDLRGVSLNGDNLAYPRLKDWNLRGADLREARLFFAHLENADLRGADLRGMLYGYASIHGQVDSFTKGLEGCRAGDRISCIR